MNLEMIRLKSAVELPEAWDSFAGEYFQQSEFLAHCETYNPCRQRYYLFYNGENLMAGLVVYTLSLNLFTYSFVRLPFNMHIAGIPCSVSSSGFIGATQLLGQIIDLVKTEERGFLVTLNLDSCPQLKDIMIGKTLPTVVYYNKHKTWVGYITSLRADYRRRLHLHARAFEGIRTVTSNCSMFTEEMYQLYLQVLERTKGKLEKLSCSFFRNLPDKFRLTAYFDGNTLLGWYISLAHTSKFYFFLGGLNYSINDKYHTYFNMLYGVLKEGIEGNYPVIDLGQTAEIPKLRLGGTLSPKWMLGYHSNWPVRKFLIAAKGILEYSESFPKYHTMKESI